MNLSDFLVTKPRICLEKVIVSDDTIFSNTENLSLQVQDYVTLSEISSSTFSCCAIYERQMTSKPENILNLKISFRILLKLNDDGKELSDDDLLDMIKKDNSITSSCGAKASIIISQISLFMISEYPIVTPPSPIDLE